jgi:pheromone a factor receptor
VVGSRTRQVLNELSYAAVAALRLFWRHRKQLDTFVFSLNEKNLTSHRYLRLMIFASLDAFWMLPFNIFVVVICGLPKYWYPWRGFADLHYHFYRVGQWPAVEWLYMDGGTLLFLLPGTAIGSSFIFFAFFGTGEEARKHYRELFKTIRRWLGSRIEQPVLQVHTIQR